MQPRSNMARVTGIAPRVDFDWRRHDGVLFDLDGVITPTAEIHERAWGELFADFDYTAADYLALHRRQAALRRGAIVPRVPRRRAPRRRSRRRPGHRHRLRDGQPQERAVQRDPRTRRHRRLPRLARHARPARRGRPSRRDRVVVEERRPGARRRRARSSDSTSSSTAWSLPPSTSPASRHPTCTCSQPDASVSHPHRAVVVEDAVSGVAAGAAGSFDVVIGVDRGAGAGTTARTRSDLRRRRPRRPAPGAVATSGFGA